MGKRMSAKRKAPYKPVSASGTGKPSKKSRIPTQGEARAMTRCNPDAHIQWEPPHDPEQDQRPGESDEEWIARIFKG